KVLDFTKFREVDHVKEIAPSTLTPKSVITDKDGNPTGESRDVADNGVYFFVYNCLAPGYTFKQDVVHSWQSTDGPYRNMVMTNNITQGTISYEYNSSDNFWSSGHFMKVDWWRVSPYRINYRKTIRFGYYRDGKWIDDYTVIEDDYALITRPFNGLFASQPVFTEADLKRIKDDFRTRYVLPSEDNGYRPLYRDPFPGPNDETLYFACKDSLRQLDTVGINWYENLSMIQEGLKYIPKSVHSAARNVAQALKAGSQRDIKTAFKSASDLFLSKKYGLDNDLRDLNALKGYKDLSIMLQKTVLTLHGSFDGVTATVLCSPFKSGWNIIEAMGIAPSASNLWAVIPFSFAVDWAFKAGHNLREIELSKMWAENEFHIHSICYSYTHQWECSCQEPIISQIPFEPFKIKLNRYRRFVSRTAPDFVYEVPDYFDGMEDHIIEAGALIFTQL
ncbi:maturation protein, partial [ssRNA phage AVE018]